MHIERLTTPQRISAISILVVILGSFLPWVTILGFSVNGLEVDGAITLVLGLAGAVTLAITSGLFGAERTPGRASTIVLVVLAALVAFIGLYDMNGAAAIGLYLTLFGGIGWVVGAVWPLVAKKDAPPAQTQAPDTAV